MKLEQRKASILRTKTRDALYEELKLLKKEAFNLRFQKANMAIKNTARMRYVKRKVATIMTLLNEPQAA
jgi:large subunit ribosomal protein L29